MLEGMAAPQCRVVRALTGKMLLYCPAASKDDFQSAIAYLTRRLDENTAQENFLTHTFGMVPGTLSWQEQSNLFSSGCRYIDEVPSMPRRSQNRLLNKKTASAAFENEPDTDWSLMQNIEWIKKMMERWSFLRIEPIPLVIGNETVTEHVEWVEGISPSFPNRVTYLYAIGSEKEAEIALRTAEKVLSSWKNIPLIERCALLEKIAERLEEKRGDLIGAMAVNTAKPVTEGDAEVSEAIDFVRYYSKSIKNISSMQDVDFSPKGVILVASPWNFSCSIPVGGIASALASGNTVIFKPAPEAVLVGWHVASAFWEAGISREVLQFFCCPDIPIASLLIQDPRISAVILTGGTATAKHILELRSGINLFAETGGKNTMIITSLADKDLAIKDLIDSAFGYSGQKCSACSLVILEAEVYEDKEFRRKLKNAASSMIVDIPWRLSSRIIPLIKSPSIELSRGLTILDDGEEWLLKPCRHPEIPNLWSPGIKLGVKAGSVTHQTELFGPVLGVMKAENLNDAIELANGTPYGLTAGIHTLDEREQKIWVKKIIAGNCYINKTITGAIVERQPFGGCKASGYGPGAKAGGPNYVLQLMDLKQKALPLEKEPIDARLASLDHYAKRYVLNPYEIDLWSASLGSYAFYWKHYFSIDQQPQILLGQSNILKYIPKDLITFRIVDNDHPIDILRVIAAAITCNAALTISCWTKRGDLFNNVWLKQTSSLALIEESEEQFLERLNNGSIKQIRMVSVPGSKMKIAAAKYLCYIAKDKVLANGRIELLHYLREVSISHNTHRYGYIRSLC